MPRFSLVDEGMIWKNPYPGAQARAAMKGNSLSLGGGSILHAMQVGQARLSPDCRCMLIRSDDYGKTWSKPWPMQIPNEAGHSATLAMLYKGSGTSVRAVASCWEFVPPDDRRFNPENGGWVNTISYLTQSDDGGKTWSKGVRFDLPPVPGGFQVVSSPVFELKDGSWMVVVEPMLIESLGTLQHEAAAIFSRDGGRTWGGKTMMAFDPNQKTLYFDPRAAQRDDGSFVALYWTHDPAKDESRQTTIGWSEDGRRWTEPQPTPLWGFLSLPLPLGGNRLLAVYNHRRNPQGNRVCISDDNGKTWDMQSETMLWDQRARRVLFEKASVSEARAWEGSVLAEMASSFDYGVPHPILLDDGSVFITYYATALDHVMHQRYIRMRVE